jgi:hypothetical protein
MLWCKQWAAFADWVKVVHGQVFGCAAHLTPRALAPYLAAELLPRRVKVWVWLPLLPSVGRSALVHRASVAVRRQDAAVKAGSLEGHAFGNSGSGSPGAITFAK